MKNNIEPLIRRHLDLHERLLWSGQPYQGLFFRKSERLFILFSYIWGIGVMYWEYAVITQSYDRFYILWGIPLVLVGLYMMCARFFIDAAKRKYTYYGMTNIRIIIISTLFKKRVTRLPLKTLLNVTYNLEKGSSIGTVVFGDITNSWLGDIYWFGKPSPPPTFERIDNAEHVYNLIRETQKNVQ